MFMPSGERAKFWPARAMGAQSMWKSCLAGVVLDDVDGLAEDQAGVEGVDGEDGGVDDETAEGEASGDGSKDEGGGDEGAVEGTCCQVASPRRLKAASCWRVVPPRHPKARNSLGLMKMGIGRQVESKRASCDELAGVGLEVKGPALVSLVEDLEDAAGGEGKFDERGGRQRFRRPAGEYSRPDWSGRPRR